MSRAMKHLHTKFILASVALGMGFVFLFGAMWTVHALPVVGITPVRTFLSAVVSSLTGCILLVFGWHGIQHELHRKR